ncbi:MAG TPA: hypothetical protein VLY45_01500 [Nitrospiria bacterium]|nr:hypothetical protein [Nitrospiria bacterium]
MKRISLIIVALSAAGLLTLAALRHQAPERHSLVAQASASAGDEPVLPGLQISEAPWAPQVSHLEERLQAIGLPALRREGTTLHLHQHLDLFVHARPVPVPPMIGINMVAGFIAPVHTHDGSGVIHIESAVVSRYTLGQFFDIWGVRFTPTCLGVYCNAGDQRLRVYVNGVPVTSNPREIGLEDNQEIVVTYGSEPELPKPIPSTFKAPSS